MSDRLEQIDTLTASFVAKAMELGMDSITVGFTYHKQGLTFAKVTGAGNWYARVHQMREFIERDSEQIRVDVRGQEEE